MMRVLIIAANILCLAAFASDERQPGAPLKGITVKVARYGGMQFAGNSMKREAASRTVLTDEHGKFRFDGLEKGQYVLTIDFPDTPEGREAKKGLNAINVKQALITINGPDATRTKVEWDLEAKMPVPAKDQTTAKAAKPKPIIVDANGTDPLTGTCETTIGKSKSNVRNN
ncbi:MAG TPA: carboxypeptidase-like regulatory domain-containing protein [Thermoanaerobaculia bacterium]|nr:carboxypeptidase-like regulatory domain-containing protein [Thermoanaerobaculia bacterium]